MIYLASTAQWALIITIGLLFFLAVYFVNAFIGPYLYAKTYFKETFARKDNSKAYESAIEGSPWYEHIKDMNIAMDNLNKEYKVKTISIYSLDTKLFGYRYEVKKPKGIILMFHEMNSNGIKEFAPLAEQYLSLQYNVLIVDQRAHGQSEGQYKTLGLLEKEDVKAWINEVKKEKLPIYLHGLSIGATTILANDNYDNSVKGIIVESPYESGFNAIASSLVINLGGRKTSRTINYISKRMNKVFGGTLNEINPAESAKKLNIPALFIVGSKDNLTFVDTKVIYENYGGEQKDLLIINGATHLECYYLNKELYMENVKKLLEGGK